MSRVEGGERIARVPWGTPGQVAICGDGGGS